MAEPQPVKTKTKAKSRYLKAKKERRKQRKTGPPDNTADARQALTLVDSDDGMEDGSPFPVAAASDVTADITPAPEEKLEEERPRKKRKVDLPKGPTETEDPALSAEVSVPENEVAIPEEEPQIPIQAPTFLPSFPLPVRPDAPSKLDLALLGVDQALIDAEMVNSTTTMPIDVDVDESGTGLSEKTRKRLVELGITELFAVQTSILPFLLKSDRTQSRTYVPYNAPRDVCVSAPTGSGKTLAYVLPIIEILSSRMITRLRALIVLPTRDLVMQVRETFEAFGKGRGLKIGTATGQHSFVHEQAQLVAERSTEFNGGSSKVDVLICTPGRLIDHLNGTKNFSLQHLRFLVIDEADRLLTQSFQDWLALVLAATRPLQNPNKLSPLPCVNGDTDSYPYPDAMAPAFIHFSSEIPNFHTAFDEQKHPSCQKLLFSATLTRDPGKISALDLKNPKYFVVQSENASDANNTLATENFSMPATLTEHMIICESSQKPLMLFHLVWSHDVNNALVFTKSAESTNRLVRLIDFLEDAFAKAKGESHKKITVCAYSSDLAPSERKSILEKFKAQQIDILVCSDLISRGIDISHVSHVISYDVPVDMRKYVHRVGRTARAGRDGDAWTLVEGQEVRYFKSMMKEANHLDRVKRLRVGEDKLGPMLPYYETALGKLKEVYGRSN